MKRFKLASALLVGTVALTACIDEQPVAPLASDAPSLSAAANLPGRYLVAFRSNGNIPASFAAEVARLGGTVELEMRGVGAALVGNLTPAAAAQLAGLNGVEAVEADALLPMHTTRTTRMAGVDAAALDMEIASPTRPDSAGLYAYQWNMRAINAPAAWKAGKTGLPTVTVAILDSGIDEGSTAAGAQRNNDLLNRVDRVKSRSFMPEEDTIVQKLFPGKPLYTDLDGHGTNVASQVSSNGINFAGVTSQSKLMSVKVCTILLSPTADPKDPETQPGYCSFNSIFAGIYYAVDQGADVINMSLGGAFLKPGSPGAASIFNRVIHYAKNRGVTVVVAAGNEAHDLDHDKSYYAAFCSQSTVICVAATGATSSGANLLGPFVNPDAPSLYSNYGSSAINVAAPGGNYSLGPVENEEGEEEIGIVGISYVVSLCPRQTAAAFDMATLSVKVVGNCGVWGFVGTSQASPHVAGLAALLVPVVGRNPAAIREVIQSTADDLGKTGTDPRYGKGRINVARALGL